MTFFSNKSITLCKVLSVCIEKKYITAPLVKFKTSTYLPSIKRLELLKLYETLKKKELFKIRFSMFRGYNFFLYRFQIWVASGHFKDMVTPKA